MEIRLLYISQSGNTRAFVNRLVSHANALGRVTFTPVEISDATPDDFETTPYFAFVPTYLDGGNGIDSGVTETLTNALGEYLDYGNNSRQILGIIGSGNKNFNIQYTLTANRYAKKYGVPMLADFELRGMPQDVTRIYDILIQRLVDKDLL
ncbi:class Ib ribonucleoside-diphosphate reductase assembly flavoprotein NrdI [Weissella ceti]|uniref:Class Ib ribonucleoside-diphosphate reductase assembly flavoprotein NrdI n=1 Tax=Weissella ceti TaxID=759620 RepID=A0ABT3E331_9LACO|nr:class Ib ribonucleoside-diphosphate reductase assembly flavoprotein NrdI [Weissella ceti]MCW0952637.1 class Ib ribonucleoside-diphosphate reductase assembly flavoprotein NrdI [Weissella ceti]QVK12342.1 class Ib ribonucleoside-diphosphate reductase assembly flavoprotein NrdI [Weissella ceti]